MSLCTSLKTMAEPIIHREHLRVRYFPEKLGKDLEIQMILVPGGVFEMGSPTDEIERSPWEGPQHEVKVESFFMGRYPVTQMQWRFVAGLPQVEVKLEPDPSHFKGSDRPVEQISWYEAVEFCERLSIYTERPYKLPSEAEWEYACRAGTTTPFYCGETITTELANYRGMDWKEMGKSGSYGDGPKGEFRGETMPVGEFPANGYGLQDMHGNVYEWCADHWHDSYKGAPTDGSVWSSDEDNTSRMIRGGSWIANPGWCRSALRYDFDPVDRYRYVGFRVVCSAPKT